MKQITRLDWLAQKDWDAYVVLQKHIWHARMESVLQEIPFPKQLGAQLAFYSPIREWHECQICCTELVKAEWQKPLGPFYGYYGDIVVCPAEWLHGDANTPHFFCQQPTRVRLRLAKEPLDYPPDYDNLRLRPLPRDSPRVFNIPASGDNDSFGSGYYAQKRKLMWTLNENGIKFKRSWAKARLWKALLSHE